MIWTLTEKESRGVLTSPKFAATFGVCSALIVLSIALGVQEYRAFGDRQAAGASLFEAELAEATSWSEVRGRAFRSTDPLHIFASGVHFDLGRFAPIRAGDEVRLQRSVYTDDPILAVFRMVDFCFIVQVVLSLLAILFTYDAVNGERERGTLALALANPVSRPNFVIGKPLSDAMGFLLRVHRAHRDVAGPIGQQDQQWLYVRVHSHLALDDLVR